MNIRRISREVRKAKLPHECWCCGHPIKPGQEYVRIVHVEDGRFTTWKYHKGKHDCIWRRK